MNRALIICGILFTVASQLIAQSGTAVGRQTAKNGEEVWLVINKIKFDKKTGVRQDTVWRSNVSYD